MWKLPKLSAMPAAVAIPRNKNIILLFILLVLVVLFECGKKITPQKALHCSARCSPANLSARAVGCGGRLERS